MISDSDYAVRIFAKIVPIQQVLEINKFGHRLLKGKDNLLYYIIYKREPFHSFGDIFGNNEGYGESINVEFLDYCIDRKVHYICFIYQFYKDGQVYIIEPQKFKELGKIRTTKQFVSEIVYGQERRKQEVTYSISMKELERIE